MKFRLNVFCRCFPSSKSDVQPVVTQKINSNWSSIFSPYKAISTRNDKKGRNYNENDDQFDSKDEIVQQKNHLGVDSGGQIHRHDLGSIHGS